MSDEFKKIDGGFSNVVCLLALLLDHPAVNDDARLLGGIDAVRNAVKAVWNAFDGTDGSTGKPTVSDLANQCHDINALFDLLLSSPHTDELETVSGAIYAIKNQFKRVWHDIELLHNEPLPA